MKKTLVIGLGISGRAAASFLLKKGKKVIAVDRKFEEIRPLLEPEIALYSDEADISLADVELVVLSPGVAPNHPLAVKARAQNIEVIGEIELAVRHLPLGSRCIGITGTNGKTTVTLLVAHVLQSCAVAARAVGNTGDPLCAHLDDSAVFVVELSSFQLETIQTKWLDAAVVLNITPDHLDRYASMRAYADAKMRIGDSLKPGKSLWISSQVQRDFGGEGKVFDSMPWERVAAISQLRYIQVGVPEQQNVQAAYALCAEYGVSNENFRRALETFRKPAHRIEWVAEKNGVSFYNDSKATNIDSVMHAVNLFEGPLILLAGGVDKGASYRPWIDCFRGKVKMIVAFGQAAHKIEEELSAAVPLRLAATIEEALEVAVKLAKPNMSVLLSPGCSSYDQFRNYEHRGDEFKRLVKGLV